MKILKNILVLLFIGSSALAQQVQLDNFNAFRNGDNVLLKWTISTGSTCNGIQVWRGEDSVTFIQIGEILGVCGSTSNPIPYEFTDANPIANKINYYKLQFSGSTFSNFISLDFILFNNAGYLITPNPVITQSAIYFSNNSKIVHTFRLYNQAGSLVQQTDNISTDKFIFRKDFLPEGIYYFTLSNDKTIRVKGKFLIQ